MKKLFLAIAFLGFMVTSYASTTTIVNVDNSVWCDGDKKCDKKKCKHDDKKACSKDKKASCKKGDSKKACCSKKDGKKSCSKKKSSKKQ